MKKKIKRICGVLLTVLLIFGMVQYAGYRLKPKSLENTYCQIQAFHMLSDNSVDVMVYGSSHSWNGFDVNVLTQQYGISAYNYSCMWQHMNTTRLFLKDSLETQSPKVVLIETYIPEILADENMNGEIYYSRYLPDSPARREYLKQCFAGDWGRYVSYYFPLVAFHESWEDIDYKSYMPLSNNISLFSQSRGFLGKDDVVPVEIPGRTKYQYDLPEDSVAVLDDMVALCHEKGIEVIFYTIPSGMKNHYADAFKQYAEQRGCAYVNLFDKVEECGIDENTDFLDKGHLNVNGAKKVAAYMGQYITDNYDLK